MTGLIHHTAPSARGKSDRGAQPPSWLLWNFQYQCILKGMKPIGAGTSFHSHETCTRHGRHAHAAHVSWSNMLWNSRAPKIGQFHPMSVSLFTRMKSPPLPHKKWHLDVCCFATKGTRWAEIHGTNCGKPSNPSVQLQMTQVTWTFQKLSYSY